MVDASLEKQNTGALAARKGTARHKVRKTGTVVAALPRWMLDGFLITKLVVASNTTTIFHHRLRVCWFPFLLDVVCLARDRVEGWMV